MAKTIEIKHVNKGYMLGEEKVPVLRDINFEVEEGRICCNSWTIRFW